jgi:hypothetical protein
MSKQLSLIQKGIFLLILSVSHHAAIAYERIIPSYYDFKITGSPLQMTPKQIYAIALAESGKKTENGIFMPHPFAISLGVDKARGVFSHEGYYPNTKKEAEHILQNLLNAGYKNIGIGMMQVNVKANPNIVDDYASLLDPLVNLEAASKVLKWCRGYFEPDQVYGCYAHGKAVKPAGIAYAERVRGYIDTFGKEWKAMQYDVKHGEISFENFLLIARQRQSNTTVLEPKPILIVN